MSELPVKEKSVPRYPKGHAGRLFMTMAAIDTLENPTAYSVAELTGLSKGNIDTYVARLNNEMDVLIVKVGSTYQIQSWGSILRRSGVMKCLHF
jgi:hypothetical protein